MKQISPELHYDLANEHCYKTLSVFRQFMYEMRTSDSGVVGGSTHGCKHRPVIKAE